MGLAARTISLSRATGFGYDGPQLLLANHQAPGPFSPCSKALKRYKLDTFRRMVLLIQ